MEKAARAVGRLTSEAQSVLEVPAAGLAMSSVSSFISLGEDYPQFPQFDGAEP